MFDDWKPCQRCRVKRPPRSLKFEFGEVDGVEIIYCINETYCAQMKRAVERGLIKADLPPAT